MEHIFSNDLCRAVIRKFYAQACNFYGSLEMPCAPKWNSHVLKFSKIDTNLAHALFVVLEPKGTDCLSIQFFSLGKALTKPKIFTDDQVAIQFIKNTLAGIKLVYSQGDDT